MFNKLILLVLVFITMSFSFVDPKYDGLMDFRYIKSKNEHMGSGSFSIHDIQLNVKLPLNKNYIIFYETHLTGNIEQFQQLYLDVDGFGLPMNIKLGRFRIPFSSEKITQKDKCFVSNSILRDAVWGNGSYLIPREENGMDVYYHSRVFSADMYLVNGNGAMTETNNDKAEKSYGVDLRFLAKEVSDFGLSIY